MTVTKLLRQKNDPSRVSVFIDGKFAFGLDEGVLLEERLHAGQNISEERLRELRERAESGKARDAALRFLGHRMRGEREVLNKLREKGFGQSEAAEAVAYVKSCGYLDDLAFTEAFIRDKMALSGYGRLRIRRELTRRGVSGESIARAYENIFPGGESAIDAAELETAAGLLFRRHRNAPIDGHDSVRKAAEFLLRRGFPGGIAAAAVKRCRAGEDDR